MAADQGEPHQWHLDVRSALTRAEQPDSTLVIDLKPKQRKTNLSLYEIKDVWGHSEADWTPILLHLRGLFVDADPGSFDRREFEIGDHERNDPIYEFLYLLGSVSEGKLTGKWIPPPASPTNGALLWPCALKYFVDCIRKRTPRVLC